METVNLLEPRVYWIRKWEGEKDLLVFDDGYYDGDIHIYEYKESITTKRIEAEINADYYNKLPNELLREIGRLWIEKNLGKSIYFDVTPSKLKK